MKKRIFLRSVSALMIGLALVVFSVLIFAGCEGSSCKHEYVSQTTKNPSCTEVGTRMLVCDRCADTKTEQIPALGHSYDTGTITTEPTCTEKGVKTYTCKNCSATKAEDLAMKRHEYDDGVITTEPTCAERGIKT